METKGLHHVNLRVDDLDVARRFYVEVMGFEEIDRPDFGFAGAWFRMGAHQLHLQTTDHPETKSGDHFALHVADCAACAAELEAKGVDVLRLDGVPGAGVQAFLRDPSGNLIELNQPTV
ncbi:MAG: lactoylglutathione lyase [Actinobacteria bacterium]|nr:lactoylglutathione lyase [Actinomycetota bacterium]